MGWWSGGGGFVETMFFSFLGLEAGIYIKKGFDMFQQKTHMVAVPLTVPHPARAKSA